MWSKYFNKKGATLLIVTAALIVMIGSISLVSDIGLMIIEKNKMKNAADAAAIAGSMELPSFPTRAEQKAMEYVVKNGFSSDVAQIIVSEDKHAITVKLKSNFKYIFARVLGHTDKDLNVKSKAEIAAVSKVNKGIRPFVVEDAPFVYGQQIVLKEGAGSGYCGNYGALALGGTGAKVFGDNIKYGYNGELSVGQMISTETGNIAGPTLEGVEYVINGVKDVIEGDYSTFNNYTPNSRRIWTIPIVDSLEVQGNSQDVKIIGFATFFVEGASKENNKAEVTGRFIEFTSNGVVSSDENQTDFGMHGVKLVE